MRPLHDVAARAEHVGPVRSRPGPGRTAGHGPSRPTHLLVAVGA